MSTKALDRHLIPLLPFLKMEGVTEICINQPGEVYIEQKGRWYCHAVSELEYTFLEALAALIAEFNHKEYPVPLLSGSLPSGERVQFVRSPACENNKIICSIRRQQLWDISLEYYKDIGVFQEIIEAKLNHSNKTILKRLYHQRDFLEFLKQAIHFKKNILISGGTGTGKTTFLNACLKCIPDSERIITVEDTREVIVNQPNRVHLLFNEEEKDITALKIFKTCLRLRPDRLFLSELRGHEVWPYLRAANSGHPGSLTTVHADTSEAAFTQLVFMMQQAGSTFTEEQLKKYIQSIIHIVIQLKRDPNSGRHMSVSDVWLNEN